MAGPSTATTRGQTRAREPVPSGHTPDAKHPRAKGAGRHHGTRAGSPPPVPDNGSLDDEYEYGDNRADGWIKAGKGGRAGKKKGKGYKG